MHIIYLNTVDSTHIYLKEYIRNNGYEKPLAIVTQNQTNGVGSRDNKWTGKNGNLFFSFVLQKDNLPKDLPLQSASIYFSFILKNILSSLNSVILLKWPNDFYCKNKKIGGTITSINKDLIYCGIGLNLVQVNNEFGYLDINIDVKNIVNKYFIALENYPSWKQIISQVKIEFQQNNDFKTNIDNKEIQLKNAILQSDGSIIINGKRVFSLR